MRELNPRSLVDNQVCCHYTNAPREQTRNAKRETEEGG